MPTFRVTSPSGKTYKITAPEGATQQQALAIAQRMEGQQQPRTAPVSPPRRSWGDYAHMAAGSVAAGIGDLADTINNFSPVNVGKNLANAITGPSSERNIYDAVAKAKGREFADTNRQAIRDAVYGKSFGDRAYAATRAPAPVTRGERIGSGAIRGATGGLVIGGPLKMGPTFVKSLAVGGTSGAGGGAGSVIGGDIAGTPGALVGGLVGGGLGGMTASRLVEPRPMPPVINQGKQAGVRIMTSDIRKPKTFIGKSAQAVGERIPYAGTGGPRVKQQAQRVAAVRTLASDYGATIGDDLAAPAINDVMTDLATKRGAELSHFTKMKESVIDQTPGFVPVPKTTAAIDSEMAKLQSLKTAEVQPVIAKLADWKQAIQGQDLKNVEILRKQIGESFKAPELAAVRGTGEKALTNIYGPLRQDMGEHIKATGGSYTQWKMANDRLSAMAGDLNNRTLRSVLKTGQGTPEDVSKLLFSSKPSDVQRLYASLTDDGRVRAQAAILQRAIEKSGGVENISPDRFTGQIKALGTQTGVFFRGKDLARVEGLRRVLEVTQRASQASLHPPTGAQNAAPILAAVLTDVLGGAGAAITTGGGVGLLARLYESAPVRNTLVALSRTKPGSAQEHLLLKSMAPTMNAIVARHVSNNPVKPPPFVNENILPSVAASPDDPGRDQQNKQAH